jgi:hypothetical protein
MQAYTFVLCAHHPTTAQVAEIRRRRKIKEDWLISMEQEIAKPWTVPLGPWEMDGLGRCSQP